MRIGYFGGSFDPIHIGHLALAEACREGARLDRVVFLVAGSPPHKLEHRLAPANHLRHDVAGVQFVADFSGMSLFFRYLEITG